MIKIYLDVCCLNRPFDDQSQDRIHLEAEAIMLILKHCERKQWQWIKSTVVDYEINLTPDNQRRVRVYRLALSAHEVIPLNNSVEIRAKELKNMGFGKYDALHVASAEEGEANIFLTTDDKLIRLSKRYAKNSKVRIENPLKWLEEVIKYD